MKYFCSLFLLLTLVLFNTSTVTASKKRPISKPVVNEIAAPVAGNYPTSLYEYLSPWDTRTERQRYTQTIEWSPPVTRTFETETQYTAILTLVPKDRGHTFFGVNVEDIIGLPEENVVEIKSEIIKESIAIYITFEKTADEYAEPELIFFDEFDGNKLDTKKWAYAPDWDRQDRSTWDSSLVSVKDGYLRLGFVPDKNLGKTKTDDSYMANNWIRAGAVRTLEVNHTTPIFMNAYGYYEARIKFPKIQGTWGAFWLMSPTLGDNIKAEIGTEIDIIETIRNEKGLYNAALNWSGYWKYHKSVHSKKTPVNIYDGKFHIFSMEWSPSEYIFYIDDVEFWRVTEGINQNPNYMKLSVEGAGYTGALPEKFEYSEMLVDYVRVYNQPKHR